MNFTEGGSQPPSYNGLPKQLLPNVVDGLANTRPESLYAMIPNSFTTYDEGFRKVTYRQFASAINGAARLLSDELGPNAKSQVLAYVAPNDIGYICFILGAVKAGHKLLLLSPRNTKADLASMLKRTGCVTILTLPPPYSQTILDILEGAEHKPRVVHVPTIFELLDTQHPHFPFPKTFEAAKDETLVIVHTSGTTNTPKLITHTHAFASSYDLWARPPLPEGYMNPVTLFQTQRALTTFPFFHAGAVFIALMSAVTTQSVMVTMLAAVPPSAQGIVDALKHVDVEVVHMVAPFMEQMAKEPDILDFVLSRVRAVTYGGADVSEAAANAFLAKVHVAGFNGSTESGTHPILRPLHDWDPADLKYIQPHPMAKFDFRPIGVLDLCEAFIVRNKDPEYTQPIFHVYPDLEEFNTKDVFSPHPTKPDLWLYRGRADDMIVSAAGEMCNPVPFEQKLARLPQISDVLMVGTGRYQKALLIQPADVKSNESSLAKETFIDRIWPTIEECNLDYPPVNQIARDHVMVTQSELPFKRTAKGTVQRVPSLEVYRQVIDDLYKSTGDAKGQIAEPYKIHLTAVKPTK